MKSFRPISITPIALKANDAPEVAELKREFNMKLRDISLAVNDVIGSLTERLLDIGLWATGEIVELNYTQASSDTQDLAVRHHLAQVPRYWIVIDQTHGIATDANVGAQKLLRGTTTWTSTHVYFRFPKTTGDIHKTHFKVLLIP